MRSVRWPSWARSCSASGWCWRRCSRWRAPPSSSTSRAHGARSPISAFPSRTLPVAALLLPLLELATAVALIPPASARWGAVAAMALLLAFIGGIANALARGEAPDCHCFGQVHSAPAGRGTLVRNAVLAVLAAVVVVEGPGPSIPDWVSARTPAELVAVAAGAAAIALAALALRLWSDRRDLRRDLAAARAELAALPPGLPVGAQAPRLRPSPSWKARRARSSRSAPGAGR